MTLTGESQETFGLHWFVIECSQVGMDLVKYVNYYFFILITFVNSLKSDQARQSARLDSNPDCLTFFGNCWKIFSNNLISQKTADDKKNHAK